MQEPHILRGGQRQRLYRRLFNTTTLLQTLPNIPAPPARELCFCSPALNNSALTSLIYISATPCSTTLPNPTPFQQLYYHLPLKNPEPPSAQQPSHTLLNSIAPTLCSTPCHHPMPLHNPATSRPPLNLVQVSYD